MFASLESMFLEVMLFLTIGAMGVIWIFLKAPGTTVSVAKGLLK